MISEKDILHRLVTTKLNSIINSLITTENNIILDCTKIKTEQITNTPLKSYITIINHKSKDSSSQIESGYFIFDSSFKMKILLSKNEFSKAKCLSSMGMYDDLNNTTILIKKYRIDILISSINCNSLSFNYTLCLLADEFVIDTSLKAKVQMKNLPDINSSDEVAYLKERLISIYQIGLLSNMKRRENEYGLIHFSETIKKSRFLIEKEDFLREGNESKEEKYVLNEFIYKIDDFFNCDSSDFDLIGCDNLFSKLGVDISLMKEETVEKTVISVNDYDEGNNEVKFLGLKREKKELFMKKDYLIVKDYIK